MMSDIAYPGGPEITRGDYGRILGRLNAYEGDNIWTDVLYHVLTEDEYEAAPDSMDRFTHDGIAYRYEPSLGEWVTR